MMFVIFECLLGMLKFTPHQSLSVQRPNIGVLIPAHNEEHKLLATLKALHDQLRVEDRVLVIADNCSDTTVQIAYQAGAEVLERHDPLKRGKGYALAAGMACFSKNPPPIIIILDADCSLSDGAIDYLVHQVQTTGKPAQAIYLMRSPPANNAVLTAVSKFAFLVKNEARPRGLARLRQPVLLTGTGMAFPWSTLKDVNLATGNIVEDLALGIELAMNGQGPLLCPQARVESELPPSKQAAVTQRTRWEHGYLKTLLYETPRLLTKGVLSLNPQLLAIGIELSVPPLSLLVILAILNVAIQTGIGLMIGYWAPALIATGQLLSMGLILFLVWVRFGRQLLTFSALISIPRYILWKIPIYLRFINQRETNWIRTERQIKKPSHYAQEGVALEVPQQLSNGPRKLIKESRYEHHYSCAHDEPVGHAVEETYFLDSLGEH
jgi:cellulose synthase/poly-beta-1,6-N-acetylglucosamine synthase-like glycosyltransferase